MQTTANQFKNPEPAPFKSGSFWGWLKINLFSSWFNTLITICLLYLLYAFSTSFINWAFINAVWFGDTAKACPNSNGACWAFVTDRWRLFVYGLYPKEDYWRVNIVYALAALTIISFLFSVALWFSGDKLGGIFVGIWAPMLVGLMIFFKLFRLER